MAEYIEREALLTVIREIFDRTDPNGEEQIGVLKCHRIVRESPTADVVPREEAERKLAECENGYQGTLFLERCKIKDLEEKNLELQTEVEKYKKPYTLYIGGRRNGKTNALVEQLRNSPSEHITIKNFYENEIRSEVAREIFEDIERDIDEKYNHYVFGNNDLDSIEQDAIINFSDSLTDCFLELKKKYTEIDNDGTTGD